MPTWTNWRAHGDGRRVPPEFTRAERRLLLELSEERRRWIAERFAPHPLKS